MNRNVESKIMSGMGIAIGTAAVVGSLVALQLGAVTLKEAGIISGFGIVFGGIFFAVKN